MIKSFIAAAAATVALAGSAVAGPFYLNGERNDGFVGGSHAGAVNELHVGVKGKVADNVDAYAQIGPAYLQPGIGNGSTEISGKAGASVAISEAVGIYGEVSFMTADGDDNYGVKTGFTVDF
tara:strand:+ start:679 stop:1044 length:366 start_codon:yes stop_codon:yes gene_type:complete